MCHVLNNNYLTNQKGKPQLLQHPNDPYFIPNIEAGHRFEGGYGPRIPIPWEEPMPSWQLEMEAKANPDENMTAEQSTQASIDAKQNSSVTSMIGINEIVHPHGWQHVNEFDSGVHQFGHAHATAFAGQQGDVINVEDSNITTALTQVNEISHKHDAAHHATSFAPQISPDGDRLTWVLMPDEETQTAFVLFSKSLQAGVKVTSSLSISRRLSNNFGINSKCYLTSVIKNTGCRCPSCAWVPAVSNAPRPSC